MKSEIIETKTIRRRDYDLINDGKLYWIATYNSIGIPEFIGSYESLEEAKTAFDQFTSK